MNAEPPHAGNPAGHILVALAACAVIAYLAWEHATHAAVLAWFGVMCALLLVRAAAMPWEVATSFLTGLAAGSAAPLFFGALPLEQRALLTMVLVSWAAASIAASNRHPRADIAFASPLFAQLAAMWLARHAPGGALVGGLLAAFYLVLVFAARERGRRAAEALALLQSEREKAEFARARAEEASVGKSLFLASASHDLRQPIHALSLLTALLHDMSSDARVQDVARQIGVAAESLDRLFSSLLDISKLDAKAVKPAVANVELRPLLEKIGADYLAQARQKGLACQLAADPVTVRTDPTLLEHILHHLLDNAVKYTESGYVRVQTRREGDGVVVAVADSGGGMPEDERPQGAGLGLALARRLAEFLQMPLRLDSVPGQGTCVELTLPVVQAAAAREFAVQPAKPAAPPVTGLHVLVVDDEPHIRLAMKALLEGMGCRASVADGADQALAAARAQRPDLVVADFRLRVQDGIATVRAIRALHPAVPALLISGELGPERLREAQEAGIALLQKPVPPEKLKRAIAELAGQPNARTALVSASAKRTP